MKLPEGVKFHYGGRVFGGDIEVPDDLVKYLPESLRKQAQPEPAQVSKPAAAPVRPTVKD